MKSRRLWKAGALAAAVFALAVGVGVASAATIIGDETDNVLTGTSQADLIKAMGGNDTSTRSKAPTRCTAAPATT